MTFARNTTEAKERRDADRARALSVLLTPSRSLHRGTYTGQTTGQAIEKPEAKRNPALLAMAKDKPCLLLVPGICNLRTDTTVACHSNLGAHGKAGARKADDQYSVWGCAACHYWLDFGKAPAAHKESVFMVSHATRQVLAWRLIAIDRKEPMADRRAAQWALDQLNATPMGEEA